MNLSDFDYTYPRGLVAQRPLPARDSSRMMVVDRRARTLNHSCVKDLPDFLEPGDLIILNDSKVVPARLFGRRGNGEPIELLVVEPLSGPGTRDPRPGKSETRDSRPETRKSNSSRTSSGSGFRVSDLGSRVPGLEAWRCLLKNSRRTRCGEVFSFGQDAATVLGREAPYLIVEFAPGALKSAMRHHGVPPLPPYIERSGFKAYTDEDRSRYQTVYARNPGSAAAPTAGLHLTRELLKKIKDRGVETAYITLHVGIDTFAPVRCEDITSHRMHGERFEIPDKTALAIERAMRYGKRIIAIGTTTVRALESAARDPEPGTRDPGPETRDTERNVRAGGNITHLFIRPDYKPKVVDAILTNFHQPRSTLLMLVSAFAGREFILNCYEEAIREQYRLFSYGDCMLIL